MAGLIERAPASQVFAAQILSCHIPHGVRAERTQTIISLMWLQASHGYQNSAFGGDESVVIDASLCPCSSIFNCPPSCKKIIDAIRISPFARSADIDRVRRHAPSLGPLALDAAGRERMIANHRNWLWIFSARSMAVCSASAGVRWSNSDLA